MRLIDSNVVMITEKDPFKKIELAGRTCYKSEEKITDESALKFYDALVKRGHTAMLEHATFIFETTEDVYNQVLRGGRTRETAGCRYLNCTENHMFGGQVRYLISGNLRAINESGIMDLLSTLAYEVDTRLVYASPYINRYTSKVINFKDIKNPSPEEISAHKYTTMRFVCDRGVSHELVRHRPYSFAQESTRYCNYSKEKFGGEMSFIKPARYVDWNILLQEIFTLGLSFAEKIYNLMTKHGATLQQARAVLPNAIKTEVVVTGNDAEWQHFFNLRSKGTTGAPHPDMKIVADKALNLYQEGEQE